MLCFFSGWCIGFLIWLLFFLPDNLNISFPDYLVGFQCCSYATWSTSFTFICVKADALVNRTHDFGYPVLCPESGFRSRVLCLSFMSSTQPMGKGCPRAAEIPSAAKGIPAVSIPTNSVTARHLGCCHLATLRQTAYKHPGRFFEGLPVDLIVSPRISSPALRLHHAHKQCD